MRCLLCTLALVVFAGCRSQTTAMTNPFLAPNRVPPPATRAPLPGTAQPYYQSAPVPSTSGFAAPPPSVTPGVPVQPAAPTFAPQPAGAVPPGGWNTTPQPLPGGSASRDVLPNNIQPASANIPLVNQPPVQVQPDQQALRFDGAVAPIQSTVPPLPPGQTLPPDPSILPTPQQGTQPFMNQQNSFQASLPQPFVQQAPTSGTPREVRIRAIPSDNLTADGSRPRDGFRPQGSSQVRKPALIDRIAPRKRQPVSEPSDRFGFDSQYNWLRGQLQRDSATGQWSLRYVPSQGRPDQFGGNLEIANPQVLGDLQPGDYVQLRGQVDQSRGPGNPMMPAYRVSVVQRQRI